MSIAVEEIYKGKVHILPEDPEAERKKTKKIKIMYRGLLTASCRRSFVLIQGGFMRKVLFISLGCDKNLADSEEMLGMLVEMAMRSPMMKVRQRPLLSIPALLSMTQKRKASTAFWKWPSIRRLEN